MDFVKTKLVDLKEEVRRPAKRLADVFESPEAEIRCLISEEAILDTFVSDTI